VHSSFSYCRFSNHSLKLKQNLQSTKKSDNLKTVSL
jgi:hypothetical protein